VLCPGRAKALDYCEGVQLDVQGRYLA
jgi:hypothetical protein